MHQGANLAVLGCCKQYDGLVPPVCCLSCWRFEVFLTPVPGGLHGTDSGLGWQLTELPDAEFELEGPA